MSCISGRCHAQGDLSCAAVDAASQIDVPNGSSGSACYGSGDIQICFDAPPTGVITSPDERPIVTTTGTGCQITTGLRAGPSSVCVIAGSDVDVVAGTTMQATGSRPLVIVATGSITIEGTLSVASTSAGVIGAGADSCASGPGQPGQGAGGGAGGSFGTLGGAGGRTSGAFGGDAGLPALLTVRGGCSGGAGGADAGGDAGGAAGAGGGAVYLLAGNQVTVDGRVDASGAGGDAAPMTSTGGGGGGGAGGYIGIDAPTIVLGGLVIAAGGGGGGGGVGGGLSAAQPGTEASTCSPANGGAGASNNASVAGDGGDGSVDNAKNGSDGGSTVGASLPSGGGGGGGGVGVVRVFGALTGTTCPAPTP